MRCWPRAASGATRTSGGCALCVELCLADAIEVLQAGFGRLDITELRVNVKEAIAGFFFDRPKPEAIRLHLVRDEVMAGK